MKDFLKIFLVFSLLLLNITQADAKKVSVEHKLDTLIKSSPVYKTSTVAVSIKDVQTGSVFYETNQHKLLHPASTLKLFTTVPAVQNLGQDYCFRTSFYDDKANNLYIKLGADPFLTSADLKPMVKELRSHNLKTVNNIYIDDSIIDNVEYGTGWMWDDDVSPYMTKFSAYNLDNNILKFSIIKTQNGQSITITPFISYPVAVLNKLKAGATNNIKLARYNWQSPDVVEFKGSVSSPQVVDLPLNNMRRYFITRLSDYLANSNIKYANENFTSAIVPADAKLIAETTHSINSVIPLILKDSNNKASETLFKVAASKYSNSTGTTEDAVKMFNAFYATQKIDTKSVIIADASGVSRNNLITVDWMSSALNAIYSNDIFPYLKGNMAQGGDGTLENRFVELRGNVWLKTGTLSNASGLTGYVNAKNNKTYSVAILTQNFAVPQADVKKLEDSIINYVYSIKD
jgi:D-alanyl-D-alanine carboxypeptidase/D-alanyl-D-alanine-endopeptidase (penicillin-binding protein 4)